MELGPIQKKWVESLRAHPERQMSGALGNKNENGTHYACCLGEFLLVAGLGRWAGGKLRDSNPFFGGGNEGDSNPFFGGGNEGTLEYSYEKLGLFDERGVIRDFEWVASTGETHHCLAGANDGGISWAEIADFVEANPEAVFSHSV